MSFHGDKFLCLLFFLSLDISEVPKFCIKFSALQVMQNKISRKSKWVYSIWASSQDNLFRGLQPG